MKILWPTDSVNILPRQRLDSLDWTWKVVAPSYREDKDHIRIITGNAIAFAALHAGKKPLPDGSVPAKVAWKAEKHPFFPVATVPGAFVQVDISVA